MAHDYWLTSRGGVSSYNLLSMSEIVLCPVLKFRKEVFQSKILKIIFF